MKPSTPLPWSIVRSLTCGHLRASHNYQGQNPEMEIVDQDIAYLNHAANLYPELVEFVRDCEGEFHCQFPEHENCGPCGACKLAVRLATLLKECQE